MIKWIIRNTFTLAYYYGVELDCLETICQMRLIDDNFYKNEVM